MRRSYTVLYVDDDIDDVLLISEAFERYTDNLTVIHAANGADGLKVLEKMSREETLPCLVIIDINMPIMDGKQMLQKLRSEAKYHGLPVILFSTSTSQKDKIFANSYDAEFISKPLDFGQLQCLVDQFVSKCRIEVTKTR